MKSFFMSVFLLSFISCASNYRKYSDKEIEAKKFKNNDFKVSKDLSDEKYLNEFKKVMCGGKDSAECGNKLKNVFIARCKDRYFASDTNKINSFCARNPMNCQDFASVEGFYILSHNEGLDNLRKKDIADSSDRASRVWAAAGTGFSNGYSKSSKAYQMKTNTPVRTNCSSRNTGFGTIETNCQSN